MHIPKNIATRSLLCAGKLIVVDIYEPQADVRTVRTKGGQCFLRTCDFEIKNGPREYLAVGISLPNDRLDAEKLAWWLPRAGLVAVIEVLCGRHDPELENIVVVAPRNPEVDPQKADMTFFRNRCRHDVLRVINQCFLDPAGPGQLDTERLQKSELLSRIYSNEDLESGMSFWAKRDILVNAVFGPRYDLDESLDSKVATLVGDYSWEECCEKEESRTTVDQTAVDVFICHASEDKDAFVRPLADALRAEGVSVWYDEYSLAMGDRLRRSIDKGLGAARYGVVVLSPAFFKKDWPQTELDGLVEKEIGSEKVILPIWHDVSRDEVFRYSPTLADRVAAKSDEPLDAVVAEIVRVVKR